MANLVDLWENQLTLDEFDRDATTPLMYPNLPQIDLPKPIDLGPIARLCQAPKPGPCYLCSKVTPTMFLDKTPICINCATFLSTGVY